MKTRIENIFDKCRQAHRAALVIFESCGFPDLETSQQVIQGAIDSGADIIELGVPFSDPMADGPIIQKASQAALKNGMTLQKVLALAERIRKRNPETGLILFSYFNVLFNYGLEALTEKLARIGIDGILSVDLPFEEKAELETRCQAHHLHLIPLVSPATSTERARMICSKASGFIYYVAVRGITGVRTSLPPQLAERLNEMRSLSSIPVVAGFGIGDAATVHTLAQHTDGIVVGSAALRPLFEEGSREQKITASNQLIRSFAKSLSKGLACSREEH